MNKRIKLVITDLDGTLIDHGQEIPRENLQALRDLKDAGIMVIPATGRGKKSAEGVIRDFPLSEYLICFQGAAIFQKNEVLWHRPVGSCIPFVKMIKEDRDIACGVFATHAEGVKDLSLISPYFKEAADYLIKQGGQPITGDNLIDIAGKDLTKVIYFGKYQDLIHIQKRWRSIGEGKHIVLSSEYTLDLTHEQARKSNAAQYITEFLGFDLENVLALGDNYNDIDLLEAAGIGVSMGQAPDEVKKRADLVTDDVSKAGFAKAIYEYVL